MNNKLITINYDNERNIIQLLRGIAIILVVFHHVLRTYSLSDNLKDLLYVVNAVHVVVFFVISGWLFEKNKEKYKRQGFLTFIKNKFCQLMIPYFIFSFVFSMLVWIGNHIGSLRSITAKISDGKEKSVIKIITDIILYKNVYFDSLWFVYTLFILMILMYLLNNNRFSSLTFTVICLVMTMLIKAYIGFFFDLDSYDILNKLITYFVWLIIGRFLFTKLGQGFVLSKKLIIASVMILCACIIRVFFIDLHDIMGLYARAIWIQIEYLLIRGTFLIVCTFLVRTLVESGKYKLLKYIGDKSYDIYLIHNPWFVSAISLGLKSLLPMVAVVFIGVVGAVLGSIIVTELIKRFMNPLYCVLFGKRRNKNVKV